MKEDRHSSFITINVILIVVLSPYVQNYFSEDIGMSPINIEHQNFQNKIKNACDALQKGKGIILVDDEDRENEGDLIFPAETISQQQVNQLIQDCSGIVCLCITNQLAKQLNLQPMVINNTSAYQTAFTTSIESKLGVKTGVSAADRWTTIHTAIKHDATSNDLNQPGHIFPLVAKESGVLSRRGHTEGSIDIMTIAGFKPAAVLCELMNKDGTMKKMPELVEYAGLHEYPILSIEDIYQYRLRYEASIKS